MKYDKLSRSTTQYKSVSTPKFFDQLLLAVVPFIGENLTWENGIFRLTDCIDKIIFSFRNGQQNLKVNRSSIDYNRKWPNTL